MSKIIKMIAIVCSIIMVLSLCAIGVAADTDNTVRNRKLVSVVYDDSGSMMNEKWEYTSYAMQCFAAMLNKEDKLDITYMSSYTSAAFSVDTNNRAEAVKQIRKHDKSGGTPSESIDYAFNTLKAHNDKNVNSQYWLIIITDGAMNGEEATDAKINRLAEEKMPNGTKPQIVYMTICDVGGSFTYSFTKNNIHTKEAPSADDVIKAISEIACDISGRYAVNNNDIQFVDDKTIKVSTDIPLTRIGILAQRSPASVATVVGTEGQGLKEECNVKVQLPGMYSDNMSAEDIAALHGNVALFGADPSNIAPDTYTITFSEKISQKDLVVMFEPAFELRLVVSVDDVVITDLTKLVADQKVDIEAILFETGTDNKILPSMLPSGAISNISLVENGKEVISEKDLKLEDVLLKGVQTTVVASLEIPGFFTVQDTIQFTPPLYKLSGVNAEVFYDGSQRRTDANGVADANNVVYITDLDTNETGVKFILYIDGKAITKEQAIAMKDSFKEGLETDFNNYKITVSEDGGLIVSPTKTWIPSLIYWLIHKGDTTIKFEHEGLASSEVLCFKIGDMKKATIDFIIFLLWILLLIWLIYWFIGKPHFRKVGTIKMYTAPSMSNPYVQDYGKTKRIHFFASSSPINFFGLAGMKKKMGRYSVRATKAGYLVEGVKGKYVSTSIPYPNATTGISPCTKKSYRFASTVYIFDGNTYYRISV